MDLYLREPLSEEPLLLLDECIQEALKVSAPLPHAMNIATVNKNSKPYFHMIKYDKLIINTNK